MPDTRPRRSPPPPRTSPRRFRAKFKSLPRWIRIPVTLGLIAAAVTLVTGITLFVVYNQIGKKFDLANLGTMPQRSVVYDVRGDVLGRLHGQNRIVVPLEKISPRFVEALLAREDARFRDHRGVDLVGVARAFFRNVRERRFVQGASTITMQLARNSFGMTERTLHRKLTEVMLARRIEAEFSKDEILELYINRIFFGGGIYGLELAAQSYFGKPAASLTLAESAMVAGIIRSPNRFSPIRNFTAACKERDDVLNRMVETGSISESQASSAKVQPIRVMPEAEPSTQDDYALDAVRRDLDLVLDAEFVEDGGLTIYTTVDADLQHAAERTLEAHLSKFESAPGFAHPRRDSGNGKSRPALPDGTTEYLQGAIVIIDNRTGGIAATVGGRDLHTSRFNRAIQGARQAGSTFKPLVYGAAYERGILPGTLVDDAPIRPGEIPAEPAWRPENADRANLGLRPLEDGLVLSRNTMTVRVGLAAGLENVAEIASTAGIPPPANPSPQILIGNIPATVKNLTSAFSIFPNGGLRKRPFIIDRIEDASGNLVYRSGIIAHPVLSPGSAALADRALRKALAPGGTGAAVRSLGFTSPAGGKTGTTNDFHDAWFVGYTAALTCGVWVGFDLPKKIADRAYGGEVALPIWTEIMKHGRHFGYQSAEVPAAPMSRDVELCRVSGRLATSGCSRLRHAYRDSLPESNIPTSRCRLHDGPTQRPLRGGSGVP